MTELMTPMTRPRAVSSRLPERVDLAHLGEGRAVVNHITRAAHSEALMVRGTGYDADRLDQPRARAARSFRTVGERLKKAPLTSRCVQLCTAVCSWRNVANGPFFSLSYRRLSLIQGFPI